MADTVVWFDIPAKNLERAVQFYSAMLDASIESKSYPGVTLAFLPRDNDRVSGCLYVHVPEDREPQLQAAVEAAAGAKATYAPLIYLNCNGRLDDAIAKVEAHGGKIVQPRQSMGDFGWRVVILDSEGNRVALYSR